MRIFIVIMILSMISSYYSEAIFSFDNIDICTSDFYNYVIEFCNRELNDIDSIIQCQEQINSKAIELAEEHNVIVTSSKLIKPGGDVMYHVSSDQCIKITIGQATYGHSMIKFHWWRHGGEGVSIGKYTAIGLGLSMYLDNGGSHCMSSAAMFPIEEFVSDRESLIALRGEKCRKQKKPITIGNDVWIGNYVSILPGVTVGDGAVLGARTVVRQDVPPFAVVIGNPAVIVRYRFSEIEIQKLLAIAWWDWDDDQISEALPLLLNGDNITPFLDKYYINASETFSLIDAA